MNSLLLFLCAIDFAATFKALSAASEKSVGTIIVLHNLNVSLKVSS
jgi:hypothetical protein